MQRVADFVARVRAIAREFQFEPVYDPAEFKKTVGRAVDEELRRWIETGELVVAPGHELRVEVSLGEGHEPSAVEVKVVESAMTSKPES